MSELMECPFCGEPAVLCEDEESETSQYFVRCSSFYCGCRLESHQLPTGAVTVWNHRPTESVLRKRVGELEAEKEQIARQALAFCGYKNPNDYNRLMKHIEAQKIAEQYKQVGKCPNCGGDVYEETGTMGDIPILVNACSNCHAIVNEPTPPETEAGDE